MVIVWPILIPNFITIAFCVQKIRAIPGVGSNQKFAVGAARNSPSAKCPSGRPRPTGGRAGPRPSRADGRRGPTGAPVGLVRARRGPTGAPVGRVRGSDALVNGNATNLRFIFFAFLEMSSNLLLLVISKRFELQFPGWRQSIGNSMNFQNLTDFFPLRCV